MQKINDGDGLEVAVTRYRCQLPGPGWRGGQGTERQGSGGGVAGESREERGEWGGGLGVQSGPGAAHAIPHPVLAPPSRPPPPEHHFRQAPPPQPKIPTRVSEVRA